MNLIADGANLVIVKPSEGGREAGVISHGPARLSVIAMSENGCHISTCVHRGRRGRRASARESVTRAETAVSDEEQRGPPRGDQSPTLLQQRVNK